MSVRAQKRRTTVSTTLRKSHISALDKIRYSVIWGGGVLLFFMLLFLVWLSIEPVMYTMQRGDIHLEQRRLNAQLRNLKRDKIRLTRQSALEAKGLVLGFHAPLRDEMIKIKASKELLEIKQSTQKGMTANK